MDERGISTFEIEKGVFDSYYIFVAAIFYIGFLFGKELPKVPQGTFVDYCREIR